MSPDELAEEARLFQAEYENGDGGALLRLLWFCAANDHPLPEWGRAAFLTIHAAAEAGEVKSWDVVFGRPLPDGKRQGGLQTESRRFEVYRRVRDIHDQEGAPIDDLLFARVGRELGIGGKTTVNRLYSSVAWLVQKLQSERQK